MKTSLTLISAGLMVSLFAGGAHAAPQPNLTQSLCSSYTAPVVHPHGLSVDEMTFGGNDATDCYGVFDGNDQNNPVWIDTGWTFLAKDNTPGGPDPLTGIPLLTATSLSSGIQFTLDAEPEEGALFGTWDLSWVKIGEPGYNLTMDVVGVLKAGNYYASYLFEDLTFTADGNSLTNSWKISYTKDPDDPNETVKNNLSHLSLYYKNVVNSTSGGTSGNTSGGTSGNTSGNIPEPGMVGLLGIGLLGQALILRQRRRRLQK